MASPDHHHAHGHDHAHEHAHGSDDPYSEAAWDERYGLHAHSWSGEPNPTLVAETSPLPPGRALDAGAGEGGDACWLASRGWQVTGVELSGVALERARSLAADKGVDVRWVHQDLTVTPPAGTYDLVTSHYVHATKSLRDRLFAHLAAAVAPGGTLLVVGHDPSDIEVPRPGLADAGWQADDIAAYLDDAFTIEVSEVRARRGNHPDGHEITIRDSVFRARRDR